MVKSAPPKKKKIARSKGVKFDPLSVYDFTDTDNADDDLSSEEIEETSSDSMDSKLQTTPKSNVKKYPGAKGPVRGKSGGKKKLLKDVGKNKGKSLQVVSGDKVIIGSKKRKLDNGPSSPSSNLKTWDFYIPPNKHFHTRVSSQTNCEVVKLLKSKLDDRQLQIFRGTRFGYFLDLPDVIVQNQLVHSLLLRQVVPENEDELWFKVNGTKLRFGLAELGIITGLKCCGDADKGYESSGPNRLMDMYFSGLKKVPKPLLVDCFLQKRWRSDEDAVKIAVLYFIHTFLFSTATKKTFITKADFDIVESGDYETFPWGILVLRAMVESMSNRLREGLKMYRLGGLPLALQCWFYECCTIVDGKLAHRVDNKVPRILNWKIKKQPTLNELSGGFFKISRDKLKFKNVSPTEFEQFHLDLPESSGNPNDEVASRDLLAIQASEDDFSTPPGEDDFSTPKKNKNQPKTQSDPPVNNLERIAELKRLSDEQSELKSDIREVFKATELLKKQMIVSFADVFKAIETLSKKQSEKDNSEIDGRDGNHDRHGDGDSSGFNTNDDHGSDGPDHGKDFHSLGDKENTEKDNIGTLGGVTNA